MAALLAPNLRPSDHRQTLGASGVYKKAAVKLAPQQKFEEQTKRFAIDSRQDKMFFQSTCAPAIWASLTLSESRLEYSPLMCESVFHVFKKLESEPKLMKSTELLRHLANKMDTATDDELASLLGLTPHLLNRWRKETTKLSPLQVANAISNAHKAAQSHVHSNTIKAIVEFFPIEATDVGCVGKKQVFPSGPDCNRYLQGLCELLTETKSGLYIFYDTRGKALYAGQTKKQNLWKEMNLAFNRDRSAQVMTLVRHPTLDVNFRPAHVKVRQPKDSKLRLHGLAAYFSAFEVLPAMVDDLEALLIRAFPNDMLNYKMEKFGKAARKAAKTKAARASSN